MSLTPLTRKQNFLAKACLDPNANYNMEPRTAQEWHLQRIYEQKLARMYNMEPRAAQERHLQKIHEQKLARMAKETGNVSAAKSTENESEAVKDAKEENVIE